MADRNRPETRREGGLSTADLATVTEERTEERELRPDERAQELPREERYPGEPLGIRVEKPEAMRREQRQEQPAAQRQPEPAPAAPPPAPQDAAQPERPAALLSDQDSQGFRSRWESIQTGFVDSPRDAVQQADGLVAELMKRLAESFAGAKSDLEQQWGRGENVSTEDLRLALRRYRSFFDRLLSI
jgi:hypothetical protein